MDYHITGWEFGMFSNFDVFLWPLAFFCQTKTPDPTVEFWILPPWDEVTIQEKCCRWSSEEISFWTFYHNLPICRCSTKKVNGFKSIIWHGRMGWIMTKPSADDIFYVNWYFCNKSSLKNIFPTVFSVWRHEWQKHNKNGCWKVDPASTRSSPAMSGSRGRR